jgi:hypothetical protein
MPVSLSGEGGEEFGCGESGLSSGNDSGIRLLRMNDESVEAALEGIPPHRKIHSGILLAPFLMIILFGKRRLSKSIWSRIMSGRMPFQG